MDQMRWGWSRDDVTELEGTVGWWSSHLHLDGWSDFRVKVTEDGEETLFRRCDNQNELEMVDLLQYATHIFLHGSGMYYPTWETDNMSKVLDMPGNTVPCLTQLVIEGFPKRSETRSVLNAISSNKLPRLTSLRLSDVDLEDFQILGAAAESGYLSALKIIDLDFTSSEPLAQGMEQGFLALPKAMESGRMTVLEELKLTKAHVGDAGWEAYAAAFRSGKLPSLAVISFSSCNIGDNGAKALGPAIMRLGALRHLALPRSEIGEEGISAILDSSQVAGKDVLSSVQFLDLSDNEVAGLSLAKAILSRRLVSLKHLDLSENRIRDEGLTAIADSLHDGGESVLPNLQSLCLEDNHFTEEVCRAFAKAISSGCLNSLQSLHVGGCYINDQRLIKLLAAFQHDGDRVLPRLRRLNLHGSYYTEAGIRALGTVFSSGFLKSLEALDISSSVREKISQEGSRAFVTALSNLKYLEEVQGNLQLHNSSERVLKKILERNSRMKAIMKGLQGSPVVPAAFSKVYICGDPEVGKTTLRKTLQRSRLKSFVSLERIPHVEQRTRGIDVSLVAGNPISLLVWDMAGQDEYQLLHNAIFLDLSSADGKATSFIIVCSSKANLEDSKTQLEYWLQFIASSCGNTTGNLRHVLVVVNNIGGDSRVMAGEQNWKEFIKGQREVFKDYLDIKMDPFIFDVRRYKSAKKLKKNLLDHARHLLRNETVPEICRFLQQNLHGWSEARQKFPVLAWKQFVKEVHEQSKEPWTEQTLEAATRYLNEAGLLVCMDVLSELGTPPRRLVVLNPNWFCKEIAGKIFLHQDMLRPKERHFRKDVDGHGSISISKFKEFLDYSRDYSSGEWTDLEIKDLVSILLWLGLCYQGKDERLYIPALILENEKPVWKYDYEQHQWVMGLIIQHKGTATSLAPIALWHRFQVELAQDSRFNGSKDNSFHNGKYFVNFRVDYMNVLIEVIVGQGSPTFDEIRIFVKPLWKRDVLDGKERKQRQVDLAQELVEILLTKVWDKICPGVEYSERVVRPWPACQTRPDVPETSLEVGEVKKWVEQHGVGKKMQFLVGSETITGDQLLSRKHKEEMGIVREEKKEGLEVGVLRPEVSYQASTLARLDIAESTEPIALRKQGSMSEDVRNELHRVRGLVEGNKEMLHAIQNYVEFFTQDRQKKCPGLIYVGERDSSSWTRKVLPWENYRLHFACEAKFKDNSHHEVKDQQGLDMRQLKDWARTVGAPWLKASLTILLVSGNIAANVVLPGIGLIIPSLAQVYQQWSAAIASTARLSRDQVEEIIAKMDVDVPNVGQHPQELYGKSIEAVRKVLDDLTPTAFKEKVGLRKVCLYHDQCSDQKIVWICDDCFKKYKGDCTPMKEL